MPSGADSWFSELLTLPYLSCILPWTPITWRSFCVKLALSPNTSGSITLSYRIHIPGIVSCRTFSIYILYIHATGHWNSIEELFIVVKCHYHSSSAHIHTPLSDRTETIDYDSHYQTFYTTSSYILEQGIHRFHYYYSSYLPIPIPVVFKA